MAEQLLAGPVEFGPEILVLLLLVIVVFPVMGIAGAVLLFVALFRHLGRNNTATYDAKAARRTRRFAIAGGLMCLPTVLLLVGRLLSLIGL